MRGLLMRTLPLAVCVTLLLLLNTAAVADMVDLPAAQDNTIYQEGDLSNGAGNHFFAGKTNRAPVWLRRALIQFNIAGNIPAGVTVDSVQLTLNVSRTEQAGNTIVALHRISRSWGEGSSKASGQEGGGAPAETGDATWQHTFFASGSWDIEGGDFNAAPSATKTVGSNEGLQSWGTSSAMVADVQQWLDQPESNFGWILIGNESQSGTSKRFDSRENLTSFVPNLQITFTLPPATGSCCTGFECQVVTEAECSGLSGSYHGDGTTCDLNPCDLAGACCSTNASCTDNFQSECAAISGASHFTGASCEQIQECPIFRNGFEGDLISQ